jgi:flavin reductase
VTRASSRAFVAAMRRMVCSVSLVATEAAGERFCLTATAVASVSAEPPTLLACVNRRLRAHGAIVSSGVFSVNLLSSDEEAMARGFGGDRSCRNQFRGQWGVLVTGAPVLEAGVANFDCELSQVVRKRMVTAVGLGRRW